MKIYRPYYSKKKALSSMGIVGKALFFTGAFSLWLDYQAWKAHFRYWHPLAWVIILLSLIAYGFGNAREVIRDLRVPKENRVYGYWKAPKEANQR